MMFVCVCNAIGDKCVSKAINDGHGDPDAVYEALGVAPQCGQCAETIEEMIFDHRCKSRMLIAAE
tara:strand:+ start:240 stop:434 length:195 start_codon:yes stop_codon:yes gene_type:complete